jgi:hypothetical protein
MMDAQLASFATVRELEYLEALEKHGSVIRAAKALKVARGSIQGAMRNLKKRAALRGYSPSHDMTKTVPDGFKVKGVSTYYDEEGKPRGQWVKSGIDEERREQIVREMLQTMAKDVKGLAPAIPAPKRSNADLMAVIPVGDPHNGLYTWAKECGDNFDTAIASKLATAAADRLIASAPACSVAVFLLLGDVLHANDQSNQTPGHKHQLDVDSRFVQVIGVAIETYRHILLRMLEKFPRVVVKLVPGNHDPQAIWALAYALHAYFVNEPRVEVDLGPSKFWYFQFGKVLIGATHGDTVKPERLPGIMAADRPEQWGASRFRYWYTGHIHSRNVTEFPGVMWESFRTLAAQDAYAASHGYRSGRDMVLIVHHREHGEVERHRCDVGMIA